MYRISALTMQQLNIERNNIVGSGLSDIARLKWNIASEFINVKLFEKA